MNIVVKLVEKSEYFNMLMAISAKWRVTPQTAVRMMVYHFYREVISNG